ncbi:MAG: low molecular weight phosphatase family protein [Deltaproteobacteria bacterium]|nr:low molecular weight phosphatase family protein [Deltaproteobacteria bacterium]
MSGALKNPMITKSVLLFLCTGNYYRSRFVEHLFNHLAAHAALPWQAESRGIAIDLGVNNRGPISSGALSALHQRGIVPTEPIRFPQQVEAADLARVHRIIALDEREHRPLLAERFPRWLDRVEFWQVPDVPRVALADGLVLMTHETQALIQLLTDARSR